MTDLTAALEQEDARLRQAVNEALQAATTRPTGKNRRALREAQRALEEFVKAAGEPDGAEQLFGSIAELVEYLEGEGWKASKSSAYDHWKKDGKLRARPDGSFALSAVLEYARGYLQRKDGSHLGENLQEDKQRAEIRRIRADADQRELKVQIVRGELIPRSQVEIELSERAQDLKNYFDAVARSAAGRIIKVVGGDPQKSAELISFMLGTNRKAFDNYSRPIKGMEEEEI